MRKQYSKRGQSLRRMKRKHKRKGVSSRRMKTGRAGMKKASPSQDLARYGVEGWCRGDNVDAAWGAPSHSVDECNLLKRRAQRKAKASRVPGAVMQPVEAGWLQLKRQELENRAQEVMQERIRAGQMPPTETVKEQDERWTREEKEAFEERQSWDVLRKAPKKSAAAGRAAAAKKKRRKAVLLTGKRPPTGKKDKRKRKKRSCK
tara:strand:+ start:565 stop:1176 length:612 start_codon:yes stop_codon:yes gene_type:complete